MYKKLVMAPLASLLVGGGAAWADEGSFPRLEVVIPIEIQDDFAFDSDDPAAELNDLYATIEPEVSLHFNSAISLVAGFVFEPVQDPGPREDRVFEDQGLFAEQVFLSYAGDGFGLQAGKFNPAFGMAWDRAPGLYGTDFAEDYELTERVGLGGSIEWGNENRGLHTLSVATFFADTTFLSESIFQDRGRTRIGSGGVSNTEDFSSVAVSLDSEAVAGLGGMGYTLGFVHQQGGRGDPEDETGFVAGLFKSVELSNGATLEPVLEWAHFENAGGAQLDRDYVTLGAGWANGPWNAALSATGRFSDSNAAGVASDDDTLVQLSGGYGFSNGVTLDIGYRFSEEANLETHMVGALLAYELGFTLPR